MPVASTNTSTSTPHNRVALVTGAGSGIGLGCAAALVADGWRGVYTGRRADALAAAIAKAGDPFGDIAERTLAVRCLPPSRSALAGLICCSTTPGCRCRCKHRIRSTLPAGAVRSTPT